MAKVSRLEADLAFAIQEGPITWMASEVLEGKPASPSWPPHFLDP